MSRVVVMLSLSLDGLFQAPGGDISWHHVTEDLHQDMNAILGACGGLLNGRRNGDLMAGFWPDITSNEPEVHKRSWRWSWRWPRALPPQRSWYWAAFVGPDVGGSQSQMAGLT